MMAGCLAKHAWQPLLYSALRVLRNQLMLHWGLSALAHDLSSYGQGIGLGLRMWLWVKMVAFLCNRHCLR